MEGRWISVLAHPCGKVCAGGSLQCEQADTQQDHRFFHWLNKRARCLLPTSDDGHLPFFLGNALFPSFPHALSGGSTRLTTGGFGAGPAIKIFAGDALNKSHTQALVKLVSPAPRALDNGRPAGRARSCCRVARPKHQYALGLRAPRDRDASSPQP